MKANQSFTRRSFLKTLGTAVVAAPFVTRGLFAQSPSGIVRHASFGASGMAWSDITELTKYKELQLVAVAEVDINRTAQEEISGRKDLPGLAQIARSRG